MILGYFDFLILAILFYLNIRFWKKQMEFLPGCLGGGLLFGLVLPIISMMVELQRVKMTIGIIDNFEVLYTYLRFPTYWIIGIIQAIVTLIKINILERKKRKADSSISHNSLSN